MLNDTELSDRCIRAADVSNFNQLAIIWQLLATAFATECEVEEGTNRKEKMTARGFFCFLFRFPKLGPGVRHSPAGEGAGAVRVAIASPLYGSPEGFPKWDPF